MSVNEAVPLGGRALGATRIGEGVVPQRKQWAQANQKQKEVPWSLPHGAHLLSPPPCAREVVLELESEQRVRVLVQRGASGEG